MDCGYPLSEWQHLAPLTCSLDGLLTTPVSSGLQGRPRGDILWQTRLQIWREGCSVHWAWAVYTVKRRSSWQGGCHVGLNNCWQHRQLIGGGKKEEHRPEGMEVGGIKKRMNWTEVDRQR